MVWPAKSQKPVADAGCSSDPPKLRSTPWPTKNNVKAKHDSGRFKNFTDNMKGDNIDDQGSNKKGNEKPTVISEYRNTRNPQESVSCQHKSIEKGKTKVDNGKFSKFADSMKDRNTNGQDRKQNGQDKKTLKSENNNIQNPQESVNCQHKSIEKGKTKVDNGMFCKFADSMKDGNTNGQILSRMDRRRRQ
ncbi:unnamed protein product [Urochloa humidicola]